MRRRTFNPEVSVMKSYNQLYDGHFTVTGRKCYCRGCGKIISGDVKKFQRIVGYNYGYKGHMLTTFNYCYKCANITMKEEFKKCYKFIKDMTKELNNITLTEKRHSNRRMKDEELIKDI